MENFISEIGYYLGCWIMFKIHPFFGFVSLFSAFVYYTHR